MRNVQYWKDVWQRLTKKIQLDQRLLEGETTFKAATANGNPEEQWVNLGDLGLAVVIPQIYLS